MRPMSGRWATGRDRERIERCVEGIVGRLRALESSTTSAEDVARSHLKVLVEECGAKKRSPELLAALAEHLGAAGVYFSPDLTDMRIAPNTVIRLARRPLTESQANKELFESEYGLEQYLLHNIGHITGFEGLRAIKTQFELPDGRRIDLLCEDIDSGDLVVVELKRAIPDRGLVSQTFEYVRALAASDFAKGRSVQALILAGVDDAGLQGDALRLAEDYGHDLTWCTYDIAMTVHKMASSIIEPVRSRAPQSQPPTPAPSREPAAPRRSRRASPAPAYEGPGHYDDRHVTPDNPWRG